MIPGLRKSTSDIHPRISIRLQRLAGAPRPDEFLGSLLLNLSSLDASRLSVCARRLRLVQDASEQSQEMVRHGNVRLAAGRPPLSIAAAMGWRSARLGGELGALRVTSWLRLGIPGNVLCMPMQWIRTNASLLTLRTCVLQRCFVPSRRFFVSEPLLFINLLLSNHLTDFLTTTLVTITQQSHQTRT
jgi:hypothetical protein